MVEAVVEVVVVLVVEVVVVVGGFVVVGSGGAKSAKAFTSFGSGDNAGGVDGDCPSLYVIGDHVPVVPAVGLALCGFQNEPIKLRYSTDQKKLPNLKTSLS